jgi:parallel beta-helix repeat protein
MKKFVLLLILTTLVQFGFSQTSIVGPKASGHWTLAGSPYNIQNTVYIPNDSTLIIDPGVTVNFQTSLTPYIHVLGRLLAVGNVTDSIHFTASDTTNGSHGIRFYGITSNNDTSKLEYCSIRYGKVNGTNYYDQNGGALLFTHWSKAIVSHCLIANCQAQAVYSYGGGIYCDSSSSPVITYNTITRCISNYGGGAICIDNNSTPNFAYNTIIWNSALGGGGIQMDYVRNFSLKHNTILNNFGSAGAGGIYLVSCQGGTIQDNIISHNGVGYGPGGGIYDTNGDTLSILNNTISYNRSKNGNSGDGGAGINCQSTNWVLIANNIIANNYTQNGNGGGIYLIQAVMVTISNNSILNNQATNTTGTGLGGAIYCNNTDPLILNTTIANNYAYEGGALYCDLVSHPVSSNCIFWGDSAASTGWELFQNDQASTPDFYYSIVQGGKAAFELNTNTYQGVYSNNLNSDPKFVSPTLGKGANYDATVSNWQLKTGSPCIDAGDPLPTYAPYPATDLGGNPRLVVCRIDMGAYENQYGASAPLSVNVTGTAAVCFHNSSTLTAHGATTYAWTPVSGLSSSVIANPVASPTVTTTYTVVGTTGICQAIDTFTLTIKPLPTLVLGSNGDTLQASGAVSYSWSSGSTHDTAVVHASGKYYVTGTGADGCSIKDSINFVITGLQSHNPAATTVKLFPVPAHDQVSVIMEGDAFRLIRIYDVLGKVLYAQELNPGTGGQSQSIDIRSLPEGIYFLQAVADHGTLTKRLVIGK